MVPYSEKTECVVRQRIYYMPDKQGNMLLYNLKLYYTSKWDVNRNDGSELFNILIVSWSQDEE